MIDKQQLTFGHILFRYNNTVDSQLATTRPQGVSNKVGLGSGFTLVSGRLRIWVWLKSGARVSRVHRGHQIMK